MKRQFIYVLLFAIICSCSDEEGVNIEVIKNNIEAKIKLQKEATNKELNIALNSNSTIYQDTITIPQYTKELYGKNTKSLWTDGFKPNKSAKSFLKIVKNAHFYGLDSNLFQVNHLASIYDSAMTNKKDSKILSTLDVLYSNELIKFAYYNKNGQSKKIITDSIIRYMAIDSISNYDLIIIKKGITSNRLHKVLDTLVPNNPFYVPLQHAVKDFFTNHKLSSKKVVVPSMKPDSAKSYNKAREALLTYNYLDSSNYKNDSLFLLNLKKFQLQHGLNNDGRIGRATAKMLSKSNKDRYLSAAISLEKLRSKSIDSSSFFMVNVPSYTLNVVEQSEIQKQFRVIVGKNATRTPVFKADMKYLIFNPYWSIPYSISSKEILPKIKKDAGEINRKGYTITDMNMKKVDVSKIDWSKVTTSNFKYRITQTRSGATALGKVKFIFPNRHSVYLHDTPTKHLFLNDIRSYSHGCIRLQNPLDLAEHILVKQNPDLTIDSINSLVNSGVQKRINLKKPIKIHIEYYTSLADTNGNIQFYNDIYGKDEMYKNVLFSKK